MLTAHGYLVGRLRLVDPRLWSLSLCYKELKNLYPSSRLFPPPPASSPKSFLSCSALATPISLSPFPSHLLFALMFS